MSSVGFAVVLRLSVIGFFKFLIWVVFIDCIAVGIGVATLFWSALCTLLIRIVFAVCVNQLCLFIVLATKAVLNYWIILWPFTFIQKE